MQVVNNARVLAEELHKRGWRLISGGTDSHLILIDTWNDLTALAPQLKQYGAIPRLEKELKTLQTKTEEHVDAANADEAYTAINPKAGEREGPSMIGYGLAAAATAGVAGALVAGAIGLYALTAKAYITRKLFGSN